MLVTLREVLKDAQEKKYGVGLFNTVNLEMAKGVLAAAEELKSPVIIGTAEVLLPYASLEELAYFLVPMAKKASVPVVLHYDHGLTDKKIVEAMRLGFSSIMYDCSTDTYENNIARVAQMVKIADMFGASVEGELGHVGANDESAGDDSIYTEPEQARISPSAPGWTPLRLPLARLTVPTRKSPGWTSGDWLRYPGQCRFPWSFTAAAGSPTRILKTAWQTASARSIFLQISTVRRRKQPMTSIRRDAV